MTHPRLCLITLKGFGIKLMLSHRLSRVVHELHLRQIEPRLTY